MEPAPATCLPPLVAGDRLDRPTFHERYCAMPAGVRADLIGGVVYMPSPLGLVHSDLDDELSYLLRLYREATPGIRSGANPTVRLGEFSEIQPDHLLRILEDRGGRCRPDDAYLAGPPELIVEVAVTTRAHDLGPKCREYERAGVLEYWVVALDPSRIHAFVLVEGKFVELAADADAILRSRAFPGLWLDPEALFAEDTPRLLATLDRGLATPEHAAFVAGLAAAAAGPG